MIRRSVLPLCLVAGILAAGCGVRDAPPPEGSRNLTAELLDTSAVERYWEIQDQLVSGVAVDDRAWNAMFSTPAFQWQASDEEARERIRERMELAFLPDRAPLEAEVAQAEDYDAIRWQHHLRIRDEREALAAYLAELRSSRVIDEALAIAQGFLPPGIVKPQEWATPVRLLFFAPDAFADDGAIYLDLVEARDRGDRLVRLLAHEFHHEYYASLSALPEIDQDVQGYWIVHALRQLHMEGTADRIDKQRYPIQERPGGLPAYAEEFNRYYLEAPRTLAQFDAALVEMARAEGGAEAAREAWNLFHYGAHPEGFFMASTIAEAQGPAALIEDLGDPFAFVRRFQDVRPVFSEVALEFLGSMETGFQASAQGDPDEDPRIDAARQIMAAARHCALITVDGAGRPRARTVDPRPPDDSMVVYLVTQPLTRKVKQIEANPDVTLYYADPAKAEYVTIMGTATLTRDPHDIERLWHPEWDAYYPNRPEDTVLIRVVPSRIEVLGRGVEPDPVTWQPQGVDLGS